MNDTSPPTFVRKPADAGKSWVDRAPLWLQPYARLARWDRPVGWQLLLLPCWLGLVLARMGEGFARIDALHAMLYVVGAIAMRGAGCTWNDYVDRELDAKVQRTAGRPLPSGQVRPRAALAFLALQLLVGALVLAALPPLAQIIALCAVPAVLVYPLMKRITYLPQLWLGFTFNIGALAAYGAAAGEISLPGVLLYIGLSLWMVGYDTVYACQDAEDDALAGVKSSVLLFGRGTRDAVLYLYAIGAVGPIAAALSLSDVSFWGAAALAVGGGAAVGSLLRQAVGMPWPKDEDGRLSERPDPADGPVYLSMFKSNVLAGLFLLGGMTAALLVTQWTR